MTPHRGGYSEDALVEQPAIALFESLGWKTININPDVAVEFIHRAI